MLCCSRKTLFIFLGIAGVIGILIATGTVNAYAILPFLPILLCPLMCLAMMFFGRQSKDDPCCQTPKKQPTPFHESNHR